MKIKQLIAILSKMDQERIVVLQIDSEGNGYNSCRGADDNAVYDGKDNGQVSIETLTKALEKQGFSEEDLGTGKPCVVLYP